MADPDSYGKHERDVEQFLKVHLVMSDGVSMKEWERLDDWIIVAMEFLAMKKKGLVKNYVFSILFHKLAVLGSGRRGSMDASVRLLQTSNRFR